MSSDRPYGDVYWMLISVLCLPVDEQIRILRADKMEQDDINFAHKNPIVHFVSALFQYYNGWYDSFSPKVVQSDQMELELEQLDLYGLSSKSISSRYNFSILGFRDSEIWKQIRNRAHQILEETEMPMRDVPDHINFHELIEIVDINDMLPNRLDAL